MLVLIDVDFDVLAVSVFSCVTCRLSYAVITIDELLEKCPSEAQVFLLYDVACSLEKYIQV